MKLIFFGKSPVRAVRWYYTHKKKTNYGWSTNQVIIDIYLCLAPFSIAQRLILYSHKIRYMSNQCYFRTRGELWHFFRAYCFCHQTTYFSWLKKFFQPELMFLVSKIQTRPVSESLKWKYLYPWKHVAIGFTFAHKIWLYFSISLFYRLQSWSFSPQHARWKECQYRLFASQTWSWSFPLMHMQVTRINLHLSLAKDEVSHLHRHVDKHPGMIHISHKSM